MSYDAVLDAMQVIGSPVFVVDRHPDGVFRFVGHNAASATALGLPNEELKGRTPHEIDPENGDMLVANYSRCLETEEQVAFEGHFEFTTSSREVKVTLSPVANPDGNYTRIVGTFTDVTWLEELRRRYRVSESRYVDSEQRYSSLLNTAPVGIVVHVNGEVYYANQEMARILGIDDPLTLVGDNVLRYLHPDYHEFAMNRIARSMKGEAISTSEQKLVLPGDGSVVDVQITGTRVNYMGMPAMQTVVKDITKEKQARAAEQQLQKERELRAFKSRFMAMVTHDFKNPLASLLLSLNTLENYWDVMDPKRRSKKFKSMYGQIDRMNDLLEDVITISKMESDEVYFSPDSIDLGVLCRELFDEVSENHGKQHRCLYQGADETVYVQADRYLLRRAIVNLLGNAIKYSPVGSTVRMSLQRSTQQRQVHIEIEDEGIGIPEHDIPVLFQPFRRASNVGNRPGTGLGLVVVKHVAELHKGTLKCKSEVGQGTQFTLTLPVGGA